LPESLGHKNSVTFFETLCMYVKQCSFFSPHDIESLASLVVLFLVLWDSFVYVTLWEVAGYWFYRFNFRSSFGA